MIDFTDLRIEGPEVIDNPDTEYTESQQVEDSRNDFSHVKTVDSEWTQKCEKDPAEGIIDVPIFKAQIVFTMR